MSRFCIEMDFIANSQENCPQFIWNCVLCNWRKENFHSNDPVLPCLQTPTGCTTLAAWPGLTRTPWPPPRPTPASSSGLLNTELQAKAHISKFKDYCRLQPFFFKNCIFTLWSMVYAVCKHLKCKCWAAAKRCCNNPCDRFLLMQITRLHRQKSDNFTVWMLLHPTCVLHL